jgi:DNA-binding MarR family transcriptional regulator
MAAMGELGPDACRAWQLLMKFFFAQRGHLPSSCGGAQFELSPIQCHVLHLIEPGRPLPMSRLAETLSCDASNVTGLVDRLEARGLIRRQPSADDRRVKVLQLTPAGLRLRGQLLRRVTGQSLPLSKLSLDQQRTLVRILETLVDEESPGNARGG